MSGRPGLEGAPAKTIQPKSSGTARGSSDLHPDELGLRRHVGHEKIVLRRRYGRRGEHDAHYRLGSIPSHFNYSVFL